jgi:DNA polymerase-3 subunit epsilon
MLKGKPKFSHVVDEFLGFVGNASLVIHNAKFDIGFLNHELGLLGRKEFKMHKVTDTLLIARNKFPGSPANLDALCDRFKIDKTSRKLHGALLDAELLALVYLNLVQAEQTMMQLDITHMEQLHNLSVLNNASFAKAILSEEEKVQHEEAIAKIESSLWKAVEDQRPKS